MRVSADLDRHNPFLLLVSILRGVLLCRSFPEVEKSKRGWHLFWYNQQITEREMFKRRLLIGDDKNRVRLDMISDKRIQQVMFTKKKFIKIPKLY